MKVCSASGRKITKIPYGMKHGTTIRVTRECPICHFIFHLQSGTIQLPGHYDCREQEFGKMELEFAAVEIAEKVGDFHNNNFMKVHLKIYIDAIFRAGFKIVKDA